MENPPQKSCKIVIKCECTSIFSYEIITEAAMIMRNQSEVSVKNSNETTHPLITLVPRASSLQNFFFSSKNAL